MHSRPEEDLGCIREQGEALSLLLPHPPVPISIPLNFRSSPPLFPASKPAFGFFFWAVRETEILHTSTASRQAISFPPSPTRFSTSLQSLLSSLLLCMHNEWASGGKSGRLSTIQGESSSDECQDGRETGLIYSSAPQNGQLGEGGIYPAIVPFTNSAN